MLWPVVLSVAGFVAAFLPVMAGWPDVPQFVPLALLGVAVVLAFLGWRRRRGRKRLALAWALGAAAAGYAYWFAFVTTYDVVTGSPPMRTTAPEFEETRVPDGAKFRLVEERGRHVFLVFFRGAWCPYCRRELRALAQRREDFEKLGARVLAIAVAERSELADLQEALGDGVILLADEDGSTASAYGVLDKGLLPDRKLARSATFFINAEGRIWANWFPTSYRELPTPDQLLPAIR